MPYYVYVIELDRDVLKSGRFRRANPGLNPALPCFYVGQTVKKPEKRFKQHKKGGRLSNTLVRKYGRVLRKSLYRKYNPIPTRKDAEDLEKMLTEKLRSQGHGVWSN